MLNEFRDLTPGERRLWLFSMAVIVASFALSGAGDWLSAIASLIDVTALIFVAKGYVLGQVLTVVFAAFYGVISFFFRYYGEMITYMCMTAPIAVMAVVSWLRHPYKGSREVTVQDVNRRQVVTLTLWAVVTTAAFYFILRALGTANLVVSTISVATSFVASYLTFLRSPYYALAYAANDVVLIILWVLAAITELSCLPMVLCFVMFLINDLYGFINWQRMRARQRA
ncbi:MAG: nicotinamide mononucleotide transporter [Clostridiales bacterium]|nr:nicotinamide mononucleotide transporter [Clostridiales bacterium]